MAKKNTYVPWEEDELNILKEKSGILPAEEIAKMLGRAVSAVRDKQEELGLIKRRKRSAAEKWKEKDLEKLRELAPTYSVEELSKKFSKSRSEIDKVRKELGIQCKNAMPPWTPAEVQKLRELAPYSTTNELAAALGKTNMSVAAKMRRLGIVCKAAGKPHTSWTKDQIDLLIQLAPEHTVSELGKIMSKPISTIYRELKERDIPCKKGRSPKWSKEEEDLLRELAPSHTKEELAQIFGRSELGILGKMVRLNLTFKKRWNSWTEKEIEQLLSLYPQHNIYEISEILGTHTVTSVRHKLRENGIKVSTDTADSTRQRWTPEEMEKLIELAPTHTVKELGDILGRPITSVKMKMRRQGIQCKTKGREWSAEEIEVLRQLYPTHSDKEVGAILGRSIHAVKQRRMILRFMKK